jgi:very-short-patch-repair endonuclease
VCLAIPGSTASHRAAAALWELPGIDRCLEVTVLDFHRIRLGGVRLHRAGQLRHEDRVWRDRIPVTSLPRTLIDLSGVLDADRLASALDHVLARRRLSLAYLSRRLGALGTRGRRGTGLLRDLIAERQGRVRHADSEPQRRLGETLRAAGLPAPEIEYPVRLSSGRMAYVDAAFPGVLLAVEVDSYLHHSTLGDWSRDRSRNNDLTALGWRVLSVTSHQLRVDPSGVVDQVAQALSCRGSQP